MKKITKLTTLIIILALFVFTFNSCSFFLIPVNIWNGDELKYTLDEDFVDSAIEQLEKAEEYTLEGKNVITINSAWSKFTDSYYFVATQSTIAYIMYNSNMSNQKYKDNYLFAVGAYQDLYARYTGALQKIYASSQRDTFFSGWAEEDIQRVLNYDAELKNLNMKDEELNIEYSDIPDDEFYDKSIEIYKQVIDNNNAIANKWGYDNYYDYATEVVYERDFGKQERESFRNSVKEYVAPIIISAGKELQTISTALTTAEKNLINTIMYGDYDSVGGGNLYINYVNSYDNSTKSAFLNAFENNNFLMTDYAGANEAAFTTYLDYYGTPFSYFGPGYQSAFTVAHEMGHYYSDLYEKNRYVSMDIAEVFSQANEMLLLGFAENELNSNVYEYIELDTLTSSLNSILTCVMVDEFEEIIYNTDVLNFTTEDFDNVMSSVCEKYYGETEVNLDNLKKSMNNYWRQVVVRQPVYYLSYAVSGTAAVLFYSDVKTDPSEAREKYRRFVEDVDVSSGFTQSLRSAGLSTPFDNQAFNKITAIFA